MPEYKILKDFDGFAKGQIQTFVGQKFIEKMKQGFGELYDRPKAEAEAKKKAETEKKAVAKAKKEAAEKVKKDAAEARIKAKVKAETEYNFVPRNKKGK